MENRLGNSDGAEIPKKSRSLDLKSLYKSGTSMESQHRKDVKRKISKEDGDDEKSKKRKKSSKTLPLSRLKNVDNSNRSVDGVYNGVVSSGLHDLNNSKSGLSHSSCSGFNGISFSLDDSGIRIPKRKRGFVGRKKVEVSQLLKPSEHSCSKVSIVDQAAKVTSDDLGTRDSSPQDSDPRFESLKDMSERLGPSKFKLKKDYDDFKENRNGGLNSARHLKEDGECANHSVVNYGESLLKKEKTKSKSNSNRHLEGGHSSNSVLNNGESSLKKPNGVSNSNSGLCLKEDDGGARKTGRNNSKRKDSALDKRSVAKEAEPLIDASSKVRKRKDSAKERRSVAKEAEPLIDDSAKVSKRKDSAWDKRSVAKEAEPLIDISGKVCDNSLEDEENLEENAAMMLSSQFDPSCTGNGLSFLLSSGRDSGGHESSLLDAAGRALRPRTRLKEKGHSRKRRHYYEIFSGDLDGYWVLYQRIKVFWPLDQCWYYGLVDGYDEGKKLHHVKYDDRDEEWINLENERFKLLLLPSEVPGKAASRRSRKREKSLDEEKGSLMSSKEKDKRNLTTKENNCMGSYMDSEPIISWLARSTRPVKSSPSPARRRQKISDLFPNEVGNAHGLDADLKTSKLSSKSEFLDRLADGERGEESASESQTCSKDSRLPIVYYRRRFCKTGSLLCSTSSGNHLSSSTPASVTVLASSIDEFWDFEEHDTFCKRKKVPDGALRPTATGNAGVSLTIPLIESRKARFEFSFPVLMILNHAFGAENLWLAHAVFWLHYGKLMTMWPSVNLEILFVDNVVGLRYFLFEGCLKEAVAYVFLVLTLFHQPNMQGKRADLKLPVTSISFKFSCFQNLRKQFVFAFYNFAEIKNSTWMYMDSELKRQCLLTRQLPLSECTYDNIKAVQNGSNRLFTASVCRDNSATKGLQRMSKPGSYLMGVFKESALVKVSQFSPNSDKKRRNLPPFALSFTAAPSFFISLHLKLLMEHSGAGMSFQGHGSTERPESDVCLMADDSGSLEYCLNKDSERTYENNVPECMLETNMSESTLDNNVKVMSKEAASYGCLPVARSELEVVSSSVCSDGNWTRFPQTYRNGDSNVAGTSANFREPEEIGTEAIVLLQKLQCYDPNSEQCVLSPRPSGDCDKTDAAAYHSPLNGIRVEIPTFDLIEKNGREYHSAQHSTDLNWNMNGGIIPSPKPTAPRSTWHRNRSSSSFGYLAHGWSDGKADIVHYNFGNAPKKPRTQVSYSLPFRGFDYSPKNRVNPQKGLPHTRIRRENGKSLSNVSRDSKKNLELLSCDANVLITHGDKCRRECGAQIVLELFEHNEWKLAVKLSGTTMYSYKAHQFLQPGSTNRYTHAMMWKGGKDWILEFPDRSQWALFKEMHEECCNRNIRAASVKNIPIPGVRLIEEFNENGTKVAFVRSSSKYFRQVETDVEMALYPSHVLYDMDSDDEQFLKIHSSLEADDSGLWDISEELFEKIMDMFEKAAYSQQRDQFTSDEIEELMAGVGSTEAIKVIYEHWRQKRQERGMPLIRHLQPPLWERYRQQVKEWELAVSKTNSSLPNGCQGKVSPIEKPPLFAFCLKPRGLEVPNKGSTHRSHRKISVSGQSNTIAGDHDFHTFGRRLHGFAFGDEKVLYPGHNYEYFDDSPLSYTSPRLFSPRVFSPRDAGSIGYSSMSNDGFDRNQYQKLQRSKSKKFGMYESSYDAQTVSYNQRLMGRRNGVHRWNSGYSEWPSQQHFYSDGFQRHGPEMLDDSDLDVFKLGDASGAAQHAHNVAKWKREIAERLLYRADLAIHKAVNALMIAEAVKTSFDDVHSDV